MKRRLLILLLSCALPGWAEERPQPGVAPVIAVVVAASQEADGLKLTENRLKLIYLRKQLYWPNGKHVLPVNLQTEHPLRSQFSQMVLSSLPSEQIDYWNGMYFNGIRPPHVVNSEEAVLRYVAQTQGAIGYLNACIVDTRVKVVLWVIGKEISTQKPELHCESVNWGFGL